jgi:AcrR family transcriptional regulator
MGRRSDGTTAAGVSASASATDRRVEIVGKAAELFDARGFHATSMEDIADAVGLRKPSLYHYFKSKDEILFLIHDEFIEILLQRHQHRMSVGMDGKTLLLEAMGDILELMDTHRGHIRVFFEAHRELPRAKHDEIVEKRTRYQRMITEVIEAMIAAGQVRSVRADLAAQGIFGMCTWAYQWYRPDGPLRPRDIAYFFWDAILNGLATPTAITAESPAPAAP